MLPYIHGEFREWLLDEAYTDQSLSAGLVVVFDRGDNDGPYPCRHMIAAVRGEYVYLSGTNNRRSDGWFHRSKITRILREVVTTPALPPKASDQVSPAR